MALLAKFTNNNITGTSTKTPTTVAKDAPEFNPNNPISIATANSKKLEELMKEAGATMLCGIFALYIQEYAKPNIKKLCKTLIIFKKLNCELLQIIVLKDKLKKKFAI